MLEQRLKLTDRNGAELEIEYHLGNGRVMLEISLGEEVFMLDTADGGEQAKANAIRNLFSQAGSLGINAQFGDFDKSDQVEV